MKDTLTTNHAMYDVIISGGGPVGLFLACELALAECTVLVLEKAEDPHSLLKEFPFGMRGLSVPSVEAFRRRGLLDELTMSQPVKEPHSYLATQSRRQVGHFAGIPFYADDVDASRWPDRLPGAPEGYLLTEMARLEAVLSRHAETLGVTIRRGAAVTDLLQTSDSVTVFTGETSFTAKWLVGCDGSRSVVRKLGGFEFAGTEPAFTGYSAKVDIADPEKLRPGRNQMPTGMYLQSQPGYVMIQDFDGGAFHDAKAPVTLEHVQAVLRRISETDVTLTALHIATTWTDRSRQATTYRNGRILLAGDAAHIHSPLGGQGLNLGLGDAMNLGWKLAATIKEQAPGNLLGSYYTERYPVGAQVLDWSRAQVAIMKPAPEARALYTIIRDMVHTRDGATYVAGRVWGIFTQYDLGGNHPLTGRSVPDFAFEDDSAVSECMHDGRALLLDFTGDAALRSKADEYGWPLRYISAKVKDALGASAVLVRPDGIVAWAADGKPDSDGFQKAADRWWMRR